MRKIVAVLASLSIAPAANAQQTNCRWIGATWSCNGTQSQSAPWGILMESRRDQQDQFNRNMQLLRERREMQRQQEIARQYQGLRETVGNMVAAGDCEGAQRAALNSGDIDLAASVKAYCQAR